MNTGKFLMGTLAGGLAFFFVGYLFYGLALNGFFASHSGGAMAKSMEEIVWWALILGNISSGALLSYIFLKWANVKSFAGGVSAAAAIGFFSTLSMDMLRFATTNTFDMTGALTNVVVGTVLTAICGGVVGAVLGMGNKA